MDGHTYHRSSWIDSYKIREILQIVLITISIITNVFLHGEVDRGAQGLKIFQETVDKGEKDTEALAALVGKQEEIIAKQEFIINTWIECNKSWEDHEKQAEAYKNLYLDGQDPMEKFRGDAKKKFDENRKRLAEEDKIMAARLSKSDRDEFTQSLIELNQMAEAGFKDISNGKALKKYIVVEGMSSRERLYLSMIRAIIIQDCAYIFSDLNIDYAFLPKSAQKTISRLIDQYTMKIYNELFAPRNEIRDIVLDACSDIAIAI